MKHSRCDIVYLSCTVHEIYCTYSYWRRVTASRSFFKDDLTLHVQVVPFTYIFLLNKTWNSYQFFVKKINKFTKKLKIPLLTIYNAEEAREIIGLYVGLRTMFLYSDNTIKNTKPVRFNFNTNDDRWEIYVIFF
jgi:hypothetical protein